MPAMNVIVWPVDELTRVFPKDSPPRDAARRRRLGWQVWSARGEYVAVHLGICGATKLADVSVSVSDITGPGGAIPGRNVRVRWMGLVPVPCDAFDGIAAERPDEAPGWYPDPLLDGPPWIPPARVTDDSPVSRRCAGMHVSFRTPQALPQGAYRGRIEVRYAGKLCARMPLTLHVWPFAMPRRGRCHISNWFHLDCLTLHHRCQPWSKRHWDILDLYARDMAEHRQNVIVTPTLIGNFHNSDPMTLVDATRERDGRWSFDLRRLGRWVELFDRHGFDLFEMWHLAGQADGECAPPFGVMDLRRGRRVSYDRLPTASGEYRGLVSAFLRTLSAWLDRRRLTRRFLIHVFDEPQRQHWARYVELSKFFRQHAPGLRHVDAISTSDLITQFGGDIDIPVPLTYHLWDEDRYYARRAAEGKQPVWWYTCSGPTGRFANRFVCAPVLNTRILHWQAFAFGITGYLHWALNFWHRTGQSASGRPGINGYADRVLLNPYREHPGPWPVGDACIVYPDPRWWEEHGPVSSLRWEAFRAGLQDYELLNMLDEAVRSAAPAAGGHALAAVAKARRLLRAVRGPVAGELRSYCRDPRRLMEIRRTAGDCLAAIR